jgi:hypothetical protein
MPAPPRGATQAKNRAARRRNHAPAQDRVTNKAGAWEGDRVSITTPATGGVVSTTKDSLLGSASTKPNVSVDRISTVRLPSLRSNCEKATVVPVWGCGDVDTQSTIAYTKPQRCPSTPIRATPLGKGEMASSNAAPPAAGCWTVKVPSMQSIGCRTRWYRRCTALQAHGRLTTQDRRATLARTASKTTHPTSTGRKRCRVQLWCQR